MSKEKEKKIQRYNIKSISVVILLHAVARKNTKEELKIGDRLIDKIKHRKS
jgi:hypothetical protein